MKILIAALFSLVTSSAFADYINVRSPEVRITGDVATQYVRMGHSTFHGQLYIKIYEPGKPVQLRSIYVHTGHIQGEEQIFTSRAMGERGVEAELQLWQGGKSTLRIGDKQFTFVPEITIYHRPPPQRPRPPFPGHH